MRRRTAGRQTAASGNAPSAGTCKGNLPCPSFYHTFHAVATGRGAGAGGRGGRSPARLRRAPRAKLVGSGEAGTGCALVCGLQGAGVRGRKQRAGVRGLIFLEGGILHEIHKLVDERALGRDKLGGNMTLGNGLIKQKRDHFDVFIC